MEFDPPQARVLEHVSGPLLVTGGPGTGKTELLRERFARLVDGGVDPERIAMFVLSRRAARDARDHLLARLRRSVADLPVFTSHGYAFRLLAARFGELDYATPPQVLSAPEQYATVRDLLLGESGNDWTAFRGLLGVATFERQVADFVLRAQERLLGPDDVDALADGSEREGMRDVARFYRRYLDALAGANQIDFGGLLQQAATLLAGGVTDEGRFDHVLVDDYQDASLAAEAIVVPLGRAAGSMVVAADPAGHVFGYRGGSLEPLGRVATALPGMQQVELATAWRPVPGSLGALETADPPAATDAGDVEARLYAHPGEEVEAVAHELLRLRVDDDIPWSRAAVVVRRYGSYLTALRHALQRHGIPFVVVAEAAALATEPANRPIIDLLRYALHPELREELVEPLLGSVIGGLDPHRLRALRREARIRDRSVLTLVDDPGADVPEELAGPVRAFRELVDDVVTWAAADRPDVVFFRVWERLGHVRRLVADAGAPGQGRARRDLDALTAFAAALGRFSERRPGASVLDYLATLDAAEFGPDPWIPPEERRPEAVRVVSAHRTQGLEFDAVCVAGCLEGEFPSLGHGAPLVGLDALTESRTPAERLADRLAEERALFRLAVSRAPHTVLFASKSTGARTPRTPSRFAARIGSPWTPPQDDDGPSTSLRSMEAGLRRAVADPQRTPERRLAAAAALHAVGAEPGRWWGRREWTDPGTPLSPETIKTSYSRLSTMENCALQYLYAVELGLDQEQSHQMWLGSLVHSIIDETQQGQLPRDLDRLLEVLGERWSSDLFPNRAVEHRRLLDAQGMITRWFQYESADPLRSEVWFEFPLDGAVIRGRIDAVFPMENGHARVVDYKTSRYPITREQARTDLQLAAYYLAIKRSEHLADVGEPGVLQLDYLGKATSDGGFARVSVSPSQIPGYEEWAEATIRELVERVRAETFAPGPEADCQFCRFRTICPRWPEGRESPVEASA